MASLLPLDLAWLKALASWGKGEWRLETRESALKKHKDNDWQLPGWSHSLSALVLASVVTAVRYFDFHHQKYLFHLFLHFSLTSDKQKLADVFMLYINLLNHLIISLRFNMAISIATTFKIANAYFFSIDVNQVKINILRKAAVLISFLEKTW